MRKDWLLVLGYCWLPWVVPAQVSTSSPTLVFDQRTFPETHPVASVKEDEIFFCLNKNPINFGQENQADIWAARSGSGTSFSRPINVGAPLNDDIANIPMALNMDGSILYVWNRGPLHSHIAYSQRQGRNWQLPQIMEVEGWGDEESSRIRHWHVSVDGQLLLLSVLAKGRSDEDLYIARRKDMSTWETPVPLIAPINSPSREVSVFLAADGRSLYFSSDRKGGLGGFDLYFIQRLDDSWARWSNPVNLGPAVNTPADETQIYLSASGETAFYVIGDPELDAKIYKAALPLDVQPLRMFLLSGKVVNASTGLPVLASVCIYTPEQEAVSINRCGIRPDRNGMFQLLVPQSRTIGIFAEKNGMYAPGYFFLPGGAWAVAEDQEATLLAELSASEPAYRDREKEIQGLQDQVREFENLLGEMEDMRKLELSRLARMEYLQDLPPFDYDIDWPLFRSRYEAMRELTNKEAAIPQDIPTSGDADPSGGTLAPVRESVYPETAQGRIQALREQQQLRNSREIAETVAAPIRLYDFEGFGKALEGLLMLKIQDSLLLDMEKEFLGQSVLSLQGSLPDAQIPVLESIAEKKRRDLISPAFESPLKRLEQFGNYPVDNPVRLNWQQVIADTLSDLLMPSISEKLIPILKNAVSAYLEFDLLCELYREQIRLLDQKLDVLTQRQIQLEKSFRRKTDIVAPMPPVASEDTLTVFSKKAINIEIRLFDPEQQPQLRLDFLLFQPNSAVPEQVSIGELQRLAAYLKQFPELQLTVETHTNGSCSHSFARDLTEARAEAIKNFLVGEGIAPDRITALGKGKYVPIASNDSPEGRRSNQRVEIFFNLPK